MKDYTRDGRGASAFENLADNSDSSSASDSSNSSSSDSNLPKKAKFFPQENFVLKHDAPGVVSMVPATVKEGDKVTVSNGSIFMITNRVRQIVDACTYVRRDIGNF